MAGSPEFMGQKPASSSQKPSFTQTCNLLSQYLKEKGSFGDLSLGMTCNVQTNGTPGMVRTAVNSFPNQMSSNVCVATPMDLFPQKAGFSTSAPVDDGPKRVDSSVTSMNICAAPEPRTAPMTIFYGGQVIVLNDFPADKAKEIILLATKCSSQNSKTNTPFTSSVLGSESSLGAPKASNDVPDLKNNVTSQECIQPAQRPISCKLPIARGASLHRFLERRKDRITSRAPYQTGSSAAASPSKASNDKQWLGLAVESPQ